MKEFVDAYEPRLDLFLQAIQRVEKARGIGDDEGSLSSLMRDSWLTKRFWFNYTARKPFDVDILFKNLLNKGTLGVESLDEEVRSGMKPFVQMKIKQLKAFDQDCKTVL